MSLAAVPTACGAAGSGRTADRSFDRRPWPVWSSCARIINQKNRETGGPDRYLENASIEDYLLMIVPEGMGL